MYLNKLFDSKQAVHFVKSCIDGNVGSKIFKKIKSNRFKAAVNDSIFKENTRYSINNNKKYELRFLIIV